MIELMIVVTIVGLLVAIALPNFASTRERAYRAAMESDLRNMVSQQESYFFDYRTYTADLDYLRSTGFQSSEGVTVTVNEATGTGWSATAEHSAVPVECYLFHGDAAPLGLADEEGIVECG